MKSSYKKKINPRKTNKLIYAVAAGVFVLLTAFILLLVLTGRPKNLQQRIEKSLSYLKNGSGIVSVQAMPEKPGALIVYNSSIANDYPRVARYAAMRLASDLENGEIWLAKDFAGQVVYRVYIRGHQVQAPE